MLDITRLQLLRTVVATGSLRASAAALGYTPSAASQQLAALQRQTGLRLTNRVGRGLEPTAAGRSLAAESEALFQELNRLDAVVGDLRAGRAGSLSIGYVTSVGATWLPPIVDALRGEFPELRLELRIAEFDSGQHDVEIIVADPRTGLPEVASPAAVVVHRLVSDPYVVVVPADDPLAGRADVRLAELADRSWIDNEHNDDVCRRVLLNACASAGITPRFQVHAPDYRTSLAFVATGIGITVMPRLAAMDLPERAIARRLVDPTPVRDIAIAVRKTIADHPAARRIVELFTTVARS